ncbi:MAG: hypothetical protein WKG07_01390 [Hymenobacter sp.]
MSELFTIPPPPQAKKFGFPKAEHLCRKKLIEQLFSKQEFRSGAYPLPPDLAAGPAPRPCPG